MKIHRDKLPVEQGSALAVTLITCTILATLVGSYFTLIETQNRSVARSQSWNQAMTVAEAGVDESLALLNSGVQSPAYAVFPWTSAGGGVFKNDTNRPACKFGTSYYQAFITNGLAGANPVIISQGYVPGPFGTLVRTVRVPTKPRPTFPVKGPMIVEQTYNASGSNVGTDSFNSTNGPYNKATAGTNGDVVCLTTNANSIVIGNASIQGSVRTPPGGVQGVTATILNGSVGDAAFISSKQSGFEAGHFRDDFTLPDFPDATAPNVTWLPPPPGGLPAPDGLIYDNLFSTPGGNYSMPSLTGSVYVGATNTVLYVTGSISVNGSGGIKKGYAPAEIHIAPGASLTIYMAGSSTTISGNGIANDSAHASAFAYYGLPSNTQISLSGNAAFVGTIYAPEADFTLKGGGNNFTNDFTGASITKTTTMTGNFNFHYDESLSQLTTLGGFDPVAWQEL